MTIRRGVVALISSFLAGALVASAPTAHAQGSLPERPPLRPASEPIRDPRDAGFAAWSAQAPDGALMAPFVFKSGRYEIVIRSARARGRDDLRAQIERAVDACAPRFDMTPPQRAELLAGDHWQAFDRAVEGMPLIVITIVPAAARPVDCASDPRSAAALLESGIRFARDSIPHGANEAASVEVRLGAKRVRPTLLGSAMVTRVAPEGFFSLDGLHLLRVYVSFDELGPSGAEPPQLKLLVSNDRGAEPTVVEIPSNVLEALWDEIRPWRLQRLAAADRPSVALELPTPRDPRLRTARSQYLEGEGVQAIPGVWTVLDAGRPRAEDRLIARLQLGHTLAAGGDEALARTEFRRVVSQEPCLQLSASAPQEVRTLLDEVRPVARCERVPTLAVVKLALIPGRAHRRLYPDRVSSGFIPLALTATAAAASIYMHIKADDKVEAYEQEVADPTAAFLVARDAHVRANLMGVATYVIWGATIADAVLSERRLERRASAVRNFGGDARPVRLDAATRGLGLAIHFF